MVARSSARVADAAACVAGRGGGSKRSGKGGVVSRKTHNVKDNAACVSRVIHKKEPRAAISARGVEFREETSKLRPRPHLECAAIGAGCQLASTIARHIP